MTSEERTRFDVDALRAVAGEMVFARGQTCQLDGRVEILGLGATRTGRFVGHREVFARAAGAETVLDSLADQVPVRAAVTLRLGDDQGSKGRYAAR